MSNKKKKSKIWSTISSLLFLLVSVFILMMMVLPFDISMSIVGVRPFVIATNSMQGQIEVGDIVVVKKVDYATLQEGDVITFFQDINNDGKKELVTHYLVQIDDENGIKRYHTKSNVSVQWDNWILSEDDIIGKVWFVVPFIGQLSLAVRNPLILVNVIVIFLLISAAILLLSSSDKDKKIDKE